MVMGSTGYRLPLPDELRQGTSAALVGCLREPSTFEGKFSSGRLELRYETIRHPFRERLAELLVERRIVDRPVSLDLLHRHLSADLMKVDESQVNAVTAACYERDAAFHEIYRSFIRDIVAGQVLRTDVWFQETPTIRFHFPRAAGMDEVDRVHNDLMLGHPPQEINGWVPLTDAGRARSFALSKLSGTRALLARFGYDLAVLQARLNDDLGFRRECRAICQTVDLGYGDAVLFDSRVLHTSCANESGVTRVSFDFRVVPVADLDRMPYRFRGTGRRRSWFVPGDYYAAETALSAS